MSQFIQLTKKLPQQTPAILRGILSKVVGPSLKSPHKRILSNHRLSHKQFSKFFEQTLDNRYIEEVKKADLLQNFCIDIQYKKMKKKLIDYGRSDYYKIERMVRNGRKQKHFGAIQSERHAYKHTLSKSPKNPQPMSLVQKIQHEYRQAKQRYSVGKIHSNIYSHDRTVYVDRKYNKQFAVKFSALKETEIVKQMKSKHQSFLSDNNQAKPLVNQIKRSLSRKKYQTQYEKKPIEELGLIRSKSAWSKNLYKPRIKQIEIQSIIKANIENHEIAKRPQIKTCQNKYRKSTSFDLINNQTFKAEKSEKQNNSKNKISIKFQIKACQVRKKQRKFTWQKDQQKYA